MGEAGTYQNNLNKHNEINNTEFKTNIDDEAVGIKRQGQKAQ